MFEFPATTVAATEHSPDALSPQAKVPRSAILVSVRDTAELRQVFENGVHWIDLKEPRNGALGCANDRQVAEFLRTYQELVSHHSAGHTNGFPRISIALGDLSDRSDLPLPPDQLRHFEMLKVGIANEALSQPEMDDRLTAWQTASGVADRFVLVQYPDATQNPQKAWGELLKVAKRHGIHRILIDTLVKNGRSTLEYYPTDLLRSLIQWANESQIETMVAGSLRLAELERVWGCGAKIIGIRSAVCQGNSRSQAIDTDRLSQLATICVNDHF
jgi:uncharacterized protein (UPF0264 family)